MRKLKAQRATVDQLMGALLPLREKLERVDGGPELLNKLDSIYAEADEQTDELLADLQRMIGRLDQVPDDMKAFEKAARRGEPLPELEPWDREERS